MEIWSNEAEQSVIGALMLDDQAYELVAETGLSVSDFHSSHHATIYKAVSDLARKGKEIDVVTVAEMLEDRRELDSIGGAGYLSRLVDIVPSIDNAAAYAGIVIERSRKRALKSLNHAALDMIEEGSSYEEIRDYVLDEAGRIAEAGDSGKIQTCRDVLKKTIDDIDEKFNSDRPLWSTGLPDLDQFVTPEESRLIGIIGATGSGKTTAAQTIAEGSLKTGIPVLMFSLEMPSTHMMKRFISSAGGVNRNFLKSPKTFVGSDEQWPKLATGSQIVSKYPIYIDDQASITIDQIQVKAKSWARKVRAEREDQRIMIVLDYIGLVKKPGKNLLTELGDISAGMKRLVNDLGACGLLLAQVSKEVSKRQGNKRPHHTDIRDSGMIENDLDVCIGVYNDEYYNADSEQAGTIELIVTKNRDGDTGTAYCRNMLKYSRIDPMPTNGNQ